MLSCRLLLGNYIFYFKFKLHRNMELIVTELVFMMLFSCLGSKSSTTK